MFDLTWLIFMGQFKANGCINKLSSAKTGKLMAVLWHSFLQNQFLALVCSCTHILQKVLYFYNAIT